MRSSSPRKSCRGRAEVRMTGFAASISGVTYRCVVIVSGVVSWCVVIVSRVVSWRGRDGATLDFVISRKSDICILGRGISTKKRPRFHALYKSPLIINDLQRGPWRRPDRGDGGHEYACGIDSDWPGSGGGQYTRDTFLTRRAGRKSGRK